MAQRNYDSLLSDIYFNSDKSGGYSSKKNLLKAAKKRNKNINERDVDKFFEQHLIPGRFRIARRRFVRRPFVSHGTGNIFGADLADMRKLYPKHNNNCTFLLVVTDIFRYFSLSSNDFF